MQSIPVDMSRLGTLRCVVEPEPKTDFESGEVKKNRDGLVTWLVGLSVRQLDSRRTSTIEVAVSGEPVGLVEGDPVTVTGLTAFVWEQNGRRGTSFRADSIVPMDTSAPAAGSGSRPSGPVGSAVTGAKSAGKSGGDA